MLKLLVTICAFLVIAMGVLGLAQYRAEVQSQTVRLHQNIEDKRQVLWNQQVEITRVSNPITLASNLRAAGILPIEQVSRPRTPPAGARPTTPTVERDLIAPLRQ